MIVNETTMILTNILNDRLVNEYSLLYHFEHYQNTYRKLCSTKHRKHNVKNNKEKTDDLIYVNNIKWKTKQTKLNDSNIQIIK